MSLAISTIVGIPAISGAGAAAPIGEIGKPGEFASLFEKAIQGVQQYTNTADQATQNMLTGQSEDLHTVAIATQQAEMAFDLALQVRNKVVEAYQEVMRMQL